MSDKFLTAPVETDRVPSGIPYIIGNEAAERFSFYGMRAILTVFMTRYLVDAAGERAVMTNEDAKFWYHAFVMAVYFFPVFGALISDLWLGKYRTILYLSVVYCFGHLALALDESRLGLFLGAGLIAVGAGGIKPCVSAHVGDQFGSKNQHLMSKIYGWFYFSINVGSMAAYIVIPRFLDHFGPGIAFGIPGILMVIATGLFWMGRHKFAHIPAGGRDTLVEAASPDGRRALWNTSLVFFFVAVFWSLYDQTGSSWVLQATRMDRNFMFLEWLPSQVGFVNPLLILIFIPLFDYVIYPQVNKFYKLTPLRKIGWGLVLIAVPFAITALIEQNMRGGQIEGSPGDLGDQFAPAKMLFGEEDQGWVSAEEPTFPLDVVIQLRERQTWKLNRIRISPLSATTVVAAQIDGENTELRKVEILTQASRADEAKSIGQLEFSAGQPAELSISDVEARFVTLRILENAGGQHVGIGEVEVFASDSPADHPNVAGVGYRPNIGWQMLAYILLTAAEVMVSITCLEFAYTQTPKTLKSVVMSLYLLSIAMGNFLAMFVNLCIGYMGEDALAGARYYWFFTGLMALATVAFVIVAVNYRGKSYVNK